MLFGGDELGRTQRGNNNAYCQDNEVSWYDWENVDKDLLAFTKTALRLRRDSPPLRPRQYLRGPKGGPRRWSCTGPMGSQMSAEDWQDPTMRTLAVALDGRQISRHRWRYHWRPVPIAPQRPPRAGQVHHPARPRQLGRRPYHRRAR